MDDRLLDFIVGRMDRDGAEVCAEPGGQGSEFVLEAEGACAIDGGEAKDGGGTHRVVMGGIGRHLREHRKHGRRAGPHARAGEGVGAEAEVDTGSGKDFRGKPLVTEVGVRAWAVGGRQQHRNTDTLV